MNRELRAQVLAEAVGSFILCFFGPGSVAVAVLCGGLSGIWQVASVWGFAIALAIYATGPISGCHINSAVTLTMVVFRRDEFPARKILPYITAQMLGGMAAAVVLLLLFGPACQAFEAAHHIVRGQPGSQLSAMWFGGYFPNPAMVGTDAAAWAQVPLSTAFVAEFIGTALMLFFIFALTDKRNELAPTVEKLHPFFIGFTVAIIIAVIGPLTQSQLNPTRDLAPRLISWLAGWGRIALPGPRGCEWWLYLVAPSLGGLAGAGVWQALQGSRSPFRGITSVESSSWTVEQETIGQRA